MDDRIIIAKLKSAYEKNTPNNVASLMKKIEKVHDEKIIRKLEERKEEKNMEKNNKKIWTVLRPVMATMALAICLFAGYQIYDINYKASSLISIDVNPSISLEVNNKEKIINAKALNKDGNKILEGIELEKVDLDTGVYAIVGSMLKNGYITEAKNSVLITVENDNKQKGEELQKKLSTEINNLLSTYQIEASILSQTVDNADNTLKQKATNNEITVGKAKLVDEIVSQNPLYTFDELAKLNVQDLNLLASSKTSSINNVIIQGQASDGGYIGKNKAKEIAFNNANIKESQAKNIEIQFDYDDGIMTYEVEFRVGNAEYDYEINAVSGKIIKSNKEIDDDQKTTTNVSSNKNNTNKENSSEPGSNNKPTTSTNSSSNTKKPTTSSSSSNNTSSNSTTTSTRIGTSKAKSIALNHAGVSSSNVYDLSVEYDYENGKSVYEVQFNTSTYEYEYYIDAKTGSVLHVEKERDD